VLGSAIFGVSEFRPLENRFAGMSYEDALAAFEAEPPVQVLFEQGGEENFAPGTPEPNFVEAFDAWPIPSAVNTIWNLSGGGSLVAGDPGGESSSTYTADPDALPETFYEGGRSSQIWQAGTEYAWQPLADGTGVGFVTEPLAADTVLVGQGSVDLWIQSDAADTDMEVTLSEVRPDGTEIFVQSAVQRASQRALNEAASTELTPVHTNAEADVADLPAGEFSLVRIDLFPFAHPFRAGSLIRLTVDAPGNSRPVWAFDTISAGEQVTIAHDADHPSRLVLSVIPGIVVPSPAPRACGALRGQPCRPWVPAVNGG
jgi:putative CocE/NonD family hydrolase